MLLKWNFGLLRRAVARFFNIKISIIIFIIFCFRVYNQEVLDVVLIVPAKQTLVLSLVLSISCCDTLINILETSLPLALVVLISSLHNQDKRRFLQEIS